MNNKTKEIILRHLKGIIIEMDKNLKKKREQKQPYMHVRKIQVKKGDDAHL